MDVVGEDVEEESVEEEVSDTDSEATVVAEESTPSRLAVATAAWRVGFQRGWLEGTKVRWEVGLK